MNNITVIARKGDRPSGIRNIARGNIASCGDTYSACAGNIGICIYCKCSQGISATYRPIKIYSASSNV
ncbi:hypothetical protein QUB60_25115 [Microcoleus sp. A2-C5]